MKGMNFRVSIFSKKKKRKEFNIYLEHTWRLREQWNRQLENGLNRGSRYDRAARLQTNKYGQGRPAVHGTIARKKEREKAIERARKGLPIVLTDVSHKEKDSLIRVMYYSVCISRVCMRACVHETMTGVREKPSYGGRDHP